MIKWGGTTLRTPLLQTLPSKCIIRNIFSQAKWKGYVRNKDFTNTITFSVETNNGKHRENINNWLYWRLIIPGTSTWPVLIFSIRSLLKKRSCGFVISSFYDLQTVFIIARGHTNCSKTIQFTCHHSRRARRQVDQSSTNRLSFLHCH